MLGSLALSQIVRQDTIGLVGDKVSGSSEVGATMSSRGETWYKDEHGMMFPMTNDRRWFPLPRQQRSAMVSLRFEKCQYR